MSRHPVTLLAYALLGVSLHAADWKQWGGGATRNMVSEEKGLPIEFNPGKKKAGSQDIDMSTTKNCAWVAKLGSQSYGTPTISEGQVYVGTNNEAPRNPQHIGDRGILMVFDEYTGQFKWQLVCPKLDTGKISDWEYLGICSAPTVVGNRGYLVTNRCEILCFDTNGLGDGNQGVQDEAQYMAALGKDGKPVIPTLGPTDADTIWRFDMRKELGVFPHNITSCYPLVVDGMVYAATSNGVDWSHTNIPAPDAPAFVCVDAATGKYVAEIPSTLKVSANVFHCNWSSPSFAKVNGKAMIFFAAGDGYVYGFGSGQERKEVEKDIYELPLKFKYDGNPPDHRKKPDGSLKKYAEFDGPSEIIATPVFVNNKLYVAVGQDPEHGEGVGQMSCIDVTKEGDQTGKAVWTFGELERTISTPAIKDGLVYESDYTGRLFCLDAETGKKYWMFDTKGHIWGSPLVVDGKIYLGNEEGELFILAEGKELKQLGDIDFGTALKGSCVAANGALYVTTDTHLFCFKEGAKPAN